MCETIRSLFAHRWPADRVYSFLRTRLRLDYALAHCGTCRGVILFLKLLGEPMRKSYSILLAGCMMFGTVAFVGCDKKSDTTTDTKNAADKANNTAESAKDKAAKANEEAQNAVNKASAATEPAVKDAADAAKEATGKAAEATKDAAEKTNEAVKKTKDAAEGTKSDAPADPNK
jgi:hypothetical protein